MDTNSTPAEIAKEIFYTFEVNQSVTISGFIEDEHDMTVITKGEQVLKCLKDLDTAENYGYEGRKMRRKRVMLENTIGGFVAQKIFKYKNEKRGNNIAYIIWRLQ